MEQNIILHDIGTEISKDLLSQRNRIVDQDIARDSRTILAAYPVTQEVEKRGLARARCTHDVQRMARHRISGDPFDNLLPSRTAATSFFTRLRLRYVHLIL